MSEAPAAIYIRFDDGFLPFARACLNSLRANWPHHPRVLADYHGADADALDLVASVGAEIAPNTEPPDFVRHLPATRAGAAALDRLSLWRRVYDGYGTILHLDADTLILAPLDHLLSRAAPFFVANHESSPEARVFVPGAAGDAELQRKLDEDGLSWPGGIDDMVNAGVFTVPPAWRSRAELARLARLAERYGRWLAFGDQSLLCLWLRAIGCAPSLDLSANFQSPMVSHPGVARQLSAVKVLHFTSGRKPCTDAFATWDRVAPARAELEALYIQYRDMGLGQ
ncbi:MAG: hypothetical protein AAF914_09220 [Pseudomonadota bacterium]